LNPSRTKKIYVPIKCLAECLTKTPDMPFFYLYPAYSNRRPYFLKKGMLLCRISPKRKKHGFYALPDQSGTHIDCQIIDTALLGGVTFHSDMKLDVTAVADEKPVILVREDFDPDINVYVGPMVTVIGTSLQNKDMLKKFQSSWNTVGLEMEGGHYQRAISAAIIKGHISKNIKVRYAYYASDNPLTSSQTLAAGEMGAEGIRPTYMVTKVDGFVKSPNSVLHGVLRHSTYIRTPRSSGLMRLAN